MYFLENYDELMKLYDCNFEKSGEYSEQEKQQFHAAMKNTKDYLTRLSNQKTVSAEEKKNAAGMYYKILADYGDMFVQDSKYPFRRKNHMYQELLQIAYMNTEKKQPMSALMKESAELLDLSGNPDQQSLTEQDPSFTAADNKIVNLQEDKNKFITFAGQLAAARKAAWGTTFRFDEMERVFNNVKDYLAGMNRELPKDENSLEQYKQLLGELQQKTKEYYDYKTNNGDERRISRLNNGEKCRADFAKKMMEFAAQESSRLTVYQSKCHCIADMKKMKKKYDELRKQDYPNNSPESRMKHLSEEVHRFSRQYNRGWRTYRPEEKDEAAAKKEYNYRLCQVLKGLSIREETSSLKEQFLKNGYLNKKIEDKAYCLASNCMHQKGYWKLRNNVFHDLVNRLSSAEYLSGNFIFMSQLAESLTANGLYHKTMTKEDKDVAKGIQQVSRIAADGTKAWESLHKLAPVNLSAHKEDVLNFVTMRAMEYQMKDRRKDHSGNSRLYRVYEALGWDENSLQVLKKNIAKTEEFRDLMKSSYEDIMLTKKETREEMEEKIRNVSKKAFKETFLSCRAEYQKTAALNPVPENAVRNMPQQKIAAVF